MYCPTCKKEVTVPGNFCNICGTRLVETPSQNDISLKISDDAAIMGGINVNRSEMHNNTSYDNRTINTSNVTNNIVERQKTEAELRNERIQQFLKCCKRAFSDGILDEEEKIELERERIILGIDKQEAERLIEMSRMSSGCRMTTLGPRDSMTLQSIDRYIDSNNRTVLNGQLPRLAALARSYKVEDVLYFYYMLLAALRPDDIIQGYESSITDEYWQTYWVSIAYTKHKNIEKAEEAIVKLSYYPEYPEDNTLLLSAVSAYNEFGAEIAADYINAILPDQCSPLLMPFIKALFQEIVPERQEEVRIDGQAYQFYIDNVIQLESHEEKEAKLRAEEEKRRAEEETKRKAEETRRKAEQQSGQAVALCPYCGWTLEPGNTFCAMCGKRVGEETDTNHSTDAAAISQELDNIFIKAEYYFDKEEYTKAVELFTKAAEQGHPEAQWSLGSCYYDGNGVEEDIFEAVKWYRKSAEQGFADAQYSLGYCYENGEGVRANIIEAVKWYKKSAEQGNAGAQCNLGVCYENGEGVEKNIKEAVKWYKKAAEQGNEFAQCNLGICYEYGEGVETNDAEAVKWYLKAAEQGNAQAQCNLACKYFSGEGVKQSYTEAVKWYRKAAEQDYADAQYYLGTCYEDGDGVEENLNEAIKWYKKAAEQEHEEAIEKLEELENDCEEDDFDSEEEDNNSNPYEKYIDMIKSGYILQAVKEYMDDNKVGLKDAKDFIDKLKAMLK